MPRACSALALLLALAGVCPASATTLRGDLATLRDQAPAAPAAAVSKKSKNRLGAVIDTLKDLLASILQQEKADGKNQKAAMCWCKKEISSKKSEIGTNTNKMGDLKIKVRQCNAKAASLKYEVNVDKKDAKELSDSMAQAKGIRDVEKAKYDKETVTNTQSIAQLNNAIKIVGKVHKAGGFLQNGVMTRMQLNEPGESNFVLGVMKSLRVSMVSNKKQADKAEATKQGLYDKLIKTKSLQLKATTDGISSKMTTLTATRLSRAQAKNDLGTLTKTTSGVKDYLFDTKTNCDNKAKEFELSTTDRQMEKAAITEAISFLKITAKEATSKFLQIGPASFLQVQSVTLSDASGLVRSADAELAQLQSAVAAGARSGAKKTVFSALTKVVDGLIAEKLKTQKEETEKKNYCVSELKKKAGEKEDSADELKGLSTSISAKNADVTTLVQGIKELNIAIAKSKKMDGEAATLRTKQKAAFDAGSKERLLALKVLKQATQVLAKFYDSQAKTTAAAAQGKGRRTVEANVVLAMMQKISEDVTKEQADAAKAEQEQAASFEKLQTDGQKEFDRRMAEMTTQVTRKAALLVQTDSQKEDKAQSAASLGAVTAQIVGLKSDCDELIKNHDAREKARGFEISQLRDVKDILAGSEVAARTGLLQAGTLAAAPGGAAGGSDASSLGDISRALDDMELRSRKIDANQ